MIEILSPSEELYCTRVILTRRRFVDYTTNETLPGFEVCLNYATRQLPHQNTRTTWYYIFGDNLPVPLCSLAFSDSRMRILIDYLNSFEARHWIVSEDTIESSGLVYESWDYLEIYLPPKVVFLFLERAFIDNDIERVYSRFNKITINTP